MQNGDCGLGSISVEKSQVIFCTGIWRTPSIVSFTYSKGHNASCIRVVNQRWIVKYCVTPFVFHNRQTHCGVLLACESTRQKCQSWVNSFCAHIFFPTLWYRVNYKLCYLNRVESLPNSTEALLEACNVFFFYSSPISTSETILKDFVQLLMIVVENCLMQVANLPYSIQLGWDLVTVKTIACIN